MIGRAQVFKWKAVLNMNYWSKNKSKDELLMNYAMIDEKTQKQLNSQLEKENIFTKIDVPQDLNTNNTNNLPSIQTNLLKRIWVFFKNAFIKFFGDGE